MLRMAGYRGQNPVFVFLSLRLIMPIAMFAIATLYVFFILKLEQPFFLKLAIVHGRRLCSATTCRRSM